YTHGKIHGTIVSWNGKIQNFKKKINSTERKYVNIFNIQTDKLLMKIGVLTFHNVPNFGAFLQAYALKRVVESFGHEVQIINLKLNPQRTFIGKIVEKINDYSFETYRSKFFRFTD